MDPGVAALSMENFVCRLQEGSRSDQFEVRLRSRSEAGSWGLHSARSQGLAPSSFQMACGRACTPAAAWWSF